MCAIRLLKKKEEKGKESEVRREPEASQNRR